MADREEPELLQLPDPCLLHVLHCCSGNLCSLFSAARAHSKLHQAAVTALSSIAVHLKSHERVQGLLTYLDKHGQHVAKIDVTGSRRQTGWLNLLPTNLFYLPAGLQLDSLTLTEFDVPAAAIFSKGKIMQGVVQPGLNLKQLRLKHCRLLEGMPGLAAALSLLPELQYLSIATHWNSTLDFGFAADVLTGLQHLTYFELSSKLQDTDYESPPLQSLTSLAQLADLRLDLKAPAAVDGSMLAEMQLLTRLEVTRCAQLDPAALAGKTQIRHLELDCSIIAAAPTAPAAAALQVPQQAAAAAGVSQLLGDLQELQQLTHLRFGATVFRDGNHPAAEFSALTASSKLQHLDISNCVLPTGVWQHLFPDDKQLPLMQWLDISWVTVTPDSELSSNADFEGSRIVSCCPSLKYVNMLRLQYSAEDLTPLQRLSGLQTLCIGSIGANEGVEAVCQLTGLRVLELRAPDVGDWLLLELTQLKQLTRLDFRVGEWAGTPTSTDPCGEPVWRQLLQHLDNMDNFDVAGQDPCGATRRPVWLQMIHCYCLGGQGLADIDGSRVEAAEQAVAALLAKIDAEADADADSESE